MMILMSFENASEALSTVEDALIEKIAEGDMQAFEKLYEAAKAAVYGFALSITKSPQDAEDVLQDTFVAVYNSAGDYIPQGKPMAWILRIARNFSLSHLRQRAKEPIAEDFLIENTEAFTSLPSIEEREAIKAVLSALSPEERQIVMLHSAAGFKNREIAELLGLKLSTVISKYRRALKKLEILLEEN